MRHVVAIALLAYTLLLRLYPRDHRKMFLAEMAGVFEQAAEEHSRIGTATFVWFFVREILGLIREAAAVRIRHDHSDNRSPGDIAEAERRVNASIRKTIHAIANHDFPGARFRAAAEQTERERLRHLREKYGSA